MPDPSIERTPSSQLRWLGVAADVERQGAETAPMQDYYAARATEYDKVYAKPERQADLRQIEQWLPSVLAGRSVLEVACGTGYWTQFFAPHCTRVVAVDCAPETIQVARSRVPPERVEFVVGDAYV